MIWISIHFEHIVQYPIYSFRLMLFSFDYIQICNKNTRSQTHVAIWMLNDDNSNNNNNRPRQCQTNANYYCYLNIMIECQGTNPIDRVSVLNRQKGLCCKLRPKK